MEYRQVITTIDSVVELFKDYCGEEDVPVDTRAVKLLLNPGSKKIAILAESDSWGTDLSPLEMKFELRRFYGV